MRLPSKLARRSMLVSAVVCVAVPVTGPAVVAPPVAAAATCQWQGPQLSEGEASFTVTRRKGVSCAGAKAVVRRCHRSNRPGGGWKVRGRLTANVTFFRGGKSFSGFVAGASPRCLS